jgi:mannose-6-phosphate isomerase-like protein (cupin superfamily)
MSQTGKPASDKKFWWSRKDEAPLIEGRRSFLEFRDLGIGAASKGWMRSQLITNKGSTMNSTGWHYHLCEAQILIMLKGWAEMEFEDGTHQRFEAGDLLFIPGGFSHNEIDISPDMEAVEFSLPAEMGTVPCEAPE